MKERTPYKLPTVVKPADGKWFVKFFFEYPDRPGQFKEFRIKDGINYIHRPEKKEEAIQQLRKDIEYALIHEGFNPFAVEKKVAAEVKEKHAAVRKAAGAMMLSQALDWYIDRLRELGKTEKTIADYRISLKRFVDYCEKVSNKERNINRIDGPDIDDVEAFLKYQAKESNWSGRSYNNNAGIITTFFNYLVKKRKLKDSPIKPGMLERRESRAEKNKYYDQRTLDKLLPRLKQEPQLRRRILWGYYTCARGSELRHLQIKDIDFNIKKISVTPEKGKLAPMSVLDRFRFALSLWK